MVIDLSRRPIDYENGWWSLIGLIKLYCLRYGNYVYFKEELHEWSFTSDFGNTSMIGRCNMETVRLLIRMFLPNDGQDLFEYLSQNEVVKYEPYNVFTKEQAKQEAINRSNNSDFWAVCLKDTGKLIGNIYLSKQEFDTWELGYVFNCNYQGKGYAAEATRALIENLFANDKARRIIAMCDPLNMASWKLLERLGMRREGHLLNNVWFFKDENDEPIWKDTYEYAILKEEWHEHNEQTS